MMTDSWMFLYPQYRDKPSGRGGGFCAMGPRITGAKLWRSAWLSTFVRRCRCNWNAGARGAHALTTMTTVIPTVPYNSGLGGTCSAFDPNEDIRRRSE